MDDAIHGKRIEAYFLGHTNLRVGSTLTSRADTCRQHKRMVCSAHPLSGSGVANAMAAHIQAGLRVQWMASRSFQTTARPEVSTSPRLFSSERGWRIGEGRA